MHSERNKSSTPAPWLPSPMAGFEPGQHVPGPEIAEELGIEYQGVDLRAGEYGYHTTKVGKIVYARPKHYWSTADLRRIQRKLFEYSILKDSDSPDPIKRLWWQELLRKITIEMMEEIFGVIDLAIPYVEIEDVIGSAESVYDTIWQIGTDALNAMIDYLWKKGMTEKAQRLQSLVDARKKG